ncbi:hypothetical protein U4959_06595 [Acinetobacter junii]|uniref:hypothetical protein n=1 Tax=Acinetobacter junii TaxID=40215 RepID=UPI002B4BF33F|nr:hypothetical protein [Acinetobacter junii]WRL36411.1 hypothetical protein U4959_06595 [Acinetobacter junii]
MKYFSSGYFKAILAQIAVLILSLFLLNMIFKGFFVDNIPHRNWLYIFHGELLIWQKTLLILIFLVFFFSTDVLVKVAYDEKKHIFNRLILIFCIPVIYVFSSLILQLLCGVASIFYFKPSLIDFLKYLFCYSSVVILITYLQNKYIVVPKEYLFMSLMKKMKIFYKEMKN